MNALPGTWREPHRDVGVPRSVALEEWAEAAVPVLEDVASRHNGYLTYGELAAKLSESTGIHTKQQLNYWISDVLGKTIGKCRERGLPELTSLVVGAGSGMVGPGFNEVLRRQDRDEISDPYDLELAAADERLECYRRYCADLPADAKAQLTREYAARVVRKAPTVSVPKPVCADCGIQLPATLVCDDCS